MRRAAVIAALAGLGLFIAVLVCQGVDALSRALAAAGWGLALVAAWHLLPLVIDSHAWRLLFVRPRPSFLRIVWARWIGESINGLLPVAQVGGDVVKARLLILHGLAAGATGAAVVVDTTLAALTQMLFGLVGLVMLLRLLDAPDLAWATAIGIAATFAGLGVFYRLQRGGLFVVLAGVLKRVGGGRAGLDFVGGARALDRAIDRLYGRPGIIARAACWRLLGWFVGVGEVWLALYFLGAPATVGQALMLEALGQAIRGAGFAIPGALGVQEGGYVVLASLIGLGPDMGLALSLAKRVRELGLGLPGLVAWQWCEGRAFRRRTSARSSVQEN